MNEHPRATDYFEKATSMRFIIFAIIVLAAASIIAKGLGHDADVKQAIYDAEAQSKRNDAQRAILTRLESKHDARVSEFVEDWRRAYPSPNPKALQELQLIEQKINNDIAAARGFTLAAHQERVKRFNDAVTSPFGGGKFEARPGL